MVLPASRPYAFLAVAAALFAGRFSSIFASAVLLNVDDCADLAALPTDAMTEDVDVLLGGNYSFICDEITTVKADGPYKFSVYGGSSTVFNNVRFDVSGGATLRFTSRLRVLFTRVTFSGVTKQTSNGGVLNVEHGSSAQFFVMPTFDHNSVQAGFSGGAVYAGGLVEFPYAANFNDNSVLGDETGPSGSGGALYVEYGGVAMLHGESIFTYNEVGDGGQGGAVANSGLFMIMGQNGRAIFTGNVAPAYTSAAGDTTGGHGGAVFTEIGGVTSISGLESADHNSAFSGGALYNLGLTYLQSPTDDSMTQFADNDAKGDDTGNGGHIFTNGGFFVMDSCTFTYGHATGNDGECDNVYDINGNPFCQSFLEAGPGKAVTSA